MLSLALLVVSAAPHLSLASTVDGGPARAGWVYARRGQQVELVARLRGGQAKDVRWYKVEPTVGAVDNTTPSFHYEPIPYQSTELPACRGALRCPADVHPTVLPATAQLAGVGTMAFQVVVTLEGGATLKTPGTETVFQGGLSPAVHRVTFRADDSLVGYATELLNTPYIFGSAGPDGKNQTDLLIGSDCADLIVYGRRRLGKKAAYTNSYNLDQQAPPLKPGARLRVGDVVHFPDMRHVALVFRDNPPLGVLDESDLLLHTCWAPPTVQPLGETGCGARPWRVLRFP